MQFFYNTQENHDIRINHIRDRLTPLTGAILKMVLTLQPMEDLKAERGGFRDQEDQIESKFACLRIALG